MSSPRAVFTFQTSYSRTSCKRLGHPGLWLVLVLCLVTPQLANAERGSGPVAAEQRVAQAKAARGQTLKGILGAGKNRLVKGAGWAARKVGGAVDRKADALAEQGHNRSAKVLRLLAGSETLLNSSLEIGFGAGMTTPFSRVFNVGAGCALWSGSIKYHEAGIDDVMLSKSFGVDSPFFGGGYSTLGKWGGGIYPLPFVSGFKDQRSYGVSVGNSGLVDLVFGEVGPSVNKRGQRVPARGPFMDFHVALPVLPFVSYLSVYIGVTSPLLRPLTKPMERPAAWLDDRGRILSETITRSGRKKLLKEHPELKTSGELLLGALLQQKNLPRPLFARSLKRRGSRLALVGQALTRQIEVPLGTLLKARNDAQRIKSYLEGPSPLRLAGLTLRSGKRGKAAAEKLRQLLSAEDYRGLCTRVDALLERINLAIDQQRQESPEPAISAAQVSGAAAL